jgi:hypothetical protein
MGTFETIALTHLYAIWDDIQTGRADPPSPGNEIGKRRRLERASRVGDVSNPAFLNLEGSLALPGGSRIYPASTAAPTAWCVLTEILGADGEASDFALEGELAADLDASLFVDGAYRLLLGRPADPQGLNDYGRLIANGSWSRFDILKHIASSDEASRWSHRVIIAPKPLIDLSDAP